MSVNYSDHGDGSNIHLRGSTPMKRIVNNVVDQQTAQEQADALEQAVYNFLAEAEAAQREKEQAAADLFAGRAALALAFENTVPGTSFTLPDGTKVSRG
jgi:hypothetical protein